MDIEYSDIISEIEKQIETEKAKSILDEFLNSPPSTDTPFETLFSILKFGFTDVFPFKYIYITLIIAIVIFILLNLYKKSNALNALKYIVTLSVIMATVLPSYKLISNAVAYMKDISTFLGVISPTIGILTAGGGNIAAAKMQAAFFSFLLGSSQIILNKAVPVILAVMFGIAIIDAFSGEGKLSSLSNFLKNCVFGFFAISVSLFYIVISVYGQAANGADTLSARSLRLLIGNAIPIIGGTVAESLKFVASGIIGIKNTVGISAVVFILALFLPILVFLWGSGIMLNLASFFCDYFNIHELKSLILHIKCTFDFSLAAFSAITVAALLNISVFIGTLPVVAA